jgi:hypothetical protein
MIRNPGGNRSSRIVVFIEDIDLRAVSAMNLASSISNNITAFSVVSDEIAKTELTARWNRLYPDTPFTVAVSPDLGIVEPLLALIETLERDGTAADKTTVILPQVVAPKRWQRLLHNHTSTYVMRQLVKQKNIDVVVIPLHLDDDDAAMEITGVRYHP